MNMKSRVRRRSSGSLPRLVEVPLPRGEAAARDHAESHRHAQRAHATAPHARAASLLLLLHFVRCFSPLGPVQTARMACYSRIDVHVCRSLCCVPRPAHGETMSGIGTHREKSVCAFFSMKSSSAPRTCIWWSTHDMHMVEHVRTRAAYARRWWHTSTSCPRVYATEPIHNTSSHSCLLASTASIMQFPFTLVGIGTTTPAMSSSNDRRTHFFSSATSYLLLFASAWEAKSTKGAESASGTHG